MDPATLKESEDRCGCPYLTYILLSTKVLTSLPFATPFLPTCGISPLSSNEHVLVRYLSNPLRAIAALVHVSTGNPVTLSFDIIAPCSG